MPRVNIKGVGMVDMPDGMSREQMRMLLAQKYSTPMSQSVSDRLSVQPTAGPVERSFSEMLSDSIGDTLYDTGVISDRYRARDTGRTLGTMAEFAPPVASAMAGDAFGQEVKQGDYIGAGISALEGSLEANPIANTVGGALLSVAPAIAKGKGFLFDPKNPEPQDLSSKTFYHGTSDVIESPSLDKTQTRDAGLLGEGFYATESPVIASSYADMSTPTSKFEGEFQSPNVHPFDVSAKNTLILSPEEGRNIKKFIKANPTRAKELTDNLKQRGYDSIAISDGDVVQEINVFDPSNVSSKFDSLIDSIGEQDLYKATNISERGLQTAEELGGMPAPSLAVASSKYPFESYGDISLVAQKDAFAKDPTFQADVYSPRFPKPDLTVPRSTVKAEEARLIDMVGEDYSPDIPSQLSSEDDLYNIPAYTAEFAKMKGIDIEPEVNSEKADEFINLFGSDIDSQLRGYDDVDDAFNDRAKTYLARRMSEKTKPIDEAIAVVDDQDMLESLEAERQRVIKRSQGYFTDGKLNEKGKRVIAQDYSKAKSDATFNPRFKRDELQKEIRDAGLIDEYNEFINQKMADLNPDKTFFNQPKFQKTGDRQDLAYNMNNALKLMKSQPLRGGEGFSYGLGNVRAEVAPRLKNLSEIQDKRGLIVAQDEFMGEKDTFEQGMFDLYNDIDIDIGELDFAQDLADYAGGRDSYIKDLDPEDLAKVDDYLNSLQDMPTEYFEIKPMRKVDLNEFYGAVVPKGTSAKVKNQLESYGLKVVEYKDDRRDAIKELNKMSGGQIMFSAGGVGLITASHMDDEEAEL